MRGVEYGEEAQKVPTTPAVAPDTAKKAQAPVTMENTESDDYAAEHSLGQK